LRHIILHHHIFKNAGTTLDFSLAAQFGTAFMHLENAGNPVDEIMLAAFLDRYPDISAISSHQLSDTSFEPVLRARGYRAFNLAMIRRPLPRLLSVYKFLKRHKSSDALGSLASRLELQPFIQTLIDNYPHFIDNAQVNILANYGFYRCAVSDNDLQKAWARYRLFSLCAPVERYDEAMVVLEYFNSPVYAPQGLNLAYIRQNTSEPLASEGELNEMIDAQSYNWLERLNRFDERLWRFANIELDRRISLIPNFSHRLAAFQDRCGQLNLASSNGS
jgi:hypothetical protein